jgi:hypothetical protein
VFCALQRGLALAAGLEPGEGEGEGIGEGGAGEGVVVLEGTEEGEVEEGAAFCADKV